MVIICLGLQMLNSNNLYRGKFARRQRLSARVSAIGNGEDEITYLATVQICGHVFKGFLYDQGADGKNEVPCVSLLQLGNFGSGKNNNNGDCSSPTPIRVPITAYPASAC
ncbi:hypothetical protein PIB30_056797 [Stylosanthes scabra]|uniref:Uncharacterized protein n=1 Tax=Stylosanthes scabra TaxID=79078 RepID=A0ABU6RKF4_9FABA|nr:hypothetical protein [Stylosanthes scabra]